MQHQTGQHGSVWEAWGFGPYVSPSPGAFVQCTNYTISHGSPRISLPGSSSFRILTSYPFWSLRPQLKCHLLWGLCPDYNKIPSFTRHAMHLLPCSIITIWNCLTYRLFICYCLPLTRMRDLRVKGSCRSQSLLCSQNQRRDWQVVSIWQIGVAVMAGCRD